MDRIVLSVQIPFCLLQKNSTAQFQLLAVTDGKKKSPMSLFYMVMDLGLTENFTILNIFDSLECVLNVLSVLLLVTAPPNVNKH